MEPKKLYTLVILLYGLTLVMFLYIGFGQIILSYNLNELKDEIHLMEQYDELSNRLQMYNKSIQHTVMMNGVYFYNGYYCVWTQNRTEELINNTNIHELCHALVKEDEKHFCNYRLIKW